MLAVACVSCTWKWACVNIYYILKSIQSLSLPMCAQLLSHVWLCNPIEYSLPGSSVHGILQARILEWVAMPSSRGSFQPRYRTCICCISSIGRWILYHWAACEALSLPKFSSVQFSSVTQSCPTLCDSMKLSTPGLPVHHQLPKSTQTHEHWVSDAIQPSHPLSSPSPLVLNLSQHQGLFKWVNSLHQVAKVLEFQLQHQFFQWIPRTDLL